MTVLRLLLRDELEANREVIIDWLKANHIDPRNVSPAWISIETYAGQTLIRWDAFKLTPDGRKLRDPRDPTKAWTVELQNRLLVELDLPVRTDPTFERISLAATEGDQTPGG